MPASFDETSLGGRVNRYGPTAARATGHKNPRLATRTVDVHAHLDVKAAHDFADGYLKPEMLPLMYFASAESAAINRQQGMDRAHAFSDPADRIAVLDQQNIDVQILSVNQAQCYYALEPAIALKASQLVNDGIATFCAFKPERFFGLGNVPLQDVGRAVGELRRVMRDLNFRGVQILTEVNDLELSDRSLEPFWAEAEALGAVVMLHPFGFTHAHRFGQYYFSNVIGNPLATSVALHHIIFSGILERYPMLKIYAVHGGGYLPMYAGRIDHAWGARIDARGTLPKPPSEYLKKVYLDTTVFTHHQLEYLVRQYGAGHIMMGTDYPADMAEYQPIEHIVSCPGLSAEEKAALAGGTAATVFGLGA